jgi:hypothetical protein
VFVQIRRAGGHTPTRNKRNREEKEEKNMFPVIMKQCAGAGCWFVSADEAMRAPPASAAVVSSKSLQ